MIKRLIISIISGFFIILLAAAIILYGRGYRYSPSLQQVSTTGILSVSSYPAKASIYIDDKLTSATDASLSLPPGWYQIKITKDGYQAWVKKIRIQGEVVSQIDALLIPNNPSLKSLTSTGVLLPTLSPSSTKVAFIVTGEDTDPVTLKSKNGVYVLELRSGTLGGQPVPEQIFSEKSKSDYTNAKIYWSPDEKELILQYPSQAYLISRQNPDETPIDVTFRLENILAKWLEEKNLKYAKNLELLPNSLSLFLSTSAAEIRFSPDETKILYEATGSSTLSMIINPPLIGTNPTEEERNISKGKYYLYDIKEDKNYFIKDVGKTSETKSPPVWYTDSKHLIIIDEKRINIVDYDGTNKRSVYSGPFQNQIVFPWSPGEKIVILTSLNQQQLPDLYEIDLR